MGARDSGEVTSTRGPALVVGAGIPPGGIDAVRQMLAVPPDSGITFLLVQRPDMGPGAIALSDLAGATSLPVLEARHGVRLRRGAVYVAPPDATVGIRDGAIELPSADPQGLPRRPLAHSFRSLASELGASAAGIVLSPPCADDGSDGLRALRCAGGLTIAQLPSMPLDTPALPSTAADPGLEADVDLLLDPAAMPDALVRFSRLPETARVPNVAGHGPEPVPVRLSDDAIGELATLLEPHGFDLGVYKTGTVQRRVFRRMGLTAHDAVHDYVTFVRDDRHERQALARDLLISVTRFFRDAEAFDVLRREVIEPLVGAARPGETLRAWVAGCATGEEAYSLAMALFEAIAGRGVRVGVQVFATDVDQDALAVARAGLYPPTIAADVPADLLSRYFTPAGGHGFQVAPHLRDAVSFAAHDVTRDPPFSRVHVVSCRNLLIYLRPDAQEHVLRVLHYALLPEGTLLLGSSESTTSTQHHLFSTVSKRWRLYRKVGRALPRMVRRGAMRQTQPVDPPSLDDDATGTTCEPGQSTGDLARRVVLQARVPPTVVVGAQGAVLFMHGELRPYLRFPDGDPHLALSALVDPDLATRVRAALYRCRRDRQTVVAYSSPARGRARRVRITATPAFELGDDAVMVTFEDVGETADDVRAADAAEPATADAVLEQLERELLATREDLRNTVEELEASNEELRSSHEESTSMNEELQSANEELEATAEELTTLNAQLREKVEQLEHATDDITNFFESSRVATLFLDRHLSIRRLTPAAAELLRVGTTDVGRFVGDIARELLQEGLIADARDVMAERAPVSRELRTREMRWLLRRVLPYRSERGAIEGVVVTFNDVTEFKVTAARLATSEQQQATIAQLGLLALEEPDLQAFFDRTVQSVQQTLRVDLCDILELQPSGEVLLMRAGAGWREGLVGDATVPGGSRSYAGFALASATPVVVSDLRSDRRFSTPHLLDEHGVRSSVTCSIERGDQPYGVLGVHTRSPRRFTDEDGHFLQAVASVVAGAIARHATRVRLGLESTVATALSDATSLDAVMADVSRAAAVQFGDGVGEYWQPDEDGTPRRTARYPSPIAPAADAAPGAPPSPAVAALVMRVLASGRAEWVTSVRERRPTRLDTDDGPTALRSAVAIPVAVGANRVGVLVHLSRQRIHADRVLLQSLETIGRTLGDCGERLDAARRLSATVDGAPVGIADRALDGRWLRVNDRLCDITGYTREELVGRPFRAFVHPDDYEREHTLAEELAAGARSRYAIEKRYVRKDGQTIWVNVSASLVTSPAGRPEYTVVVVEDISARKRAERDLRLSESRFRDVLRGSPVPMLLQDERGRVLAVSDSWAAFTGFAPDDTPTFDDWVRVACLDDPVAVQALHMREDAPGPAGIECDIRTKHGDVRTVELSVMPLAPAADGLGLRLATILDLTAQRAYEREVEHASQQKDEFIAMLSHELRNPLAAMRSATEVLKRAGHDTGTVRHAQQVLERQGTHMARLLDGLLDISRIVLGRIDVVHEPLDLCALVQEAAGDARNLAADAGLTLEVACTSGPVWVLGDALRLTQAIDNLIGNARKFTPPPGTIHVSLEVEGGEAVLRVRDTGIGIEPSLLPRVFEAFRQGAQRIDRARGGLGLGLALVKLLVEQQGGAVSAASEGEGRGAEFTIRLPLAEAPALGASPAATPAPARRRVLVVEDSEDGAEMMQVLLGQMGHDVLTATRGADAIEAARTTPLDVVLCDLGLPDGVTGYDVARALRADAATRAIPLVALTGYGRPEDRERTTAAGFDEHLTKPVSIDDLERVLRDLPARQDE